jgi:hypothetical protein
MLHSETLSKESFAPGLFLWLPIACLNQGLLNKEMRHGFNKISSPKLYINTI